jgi:ribosomal protein L24E
MPNTDAFAIAALHPGEGRTVIDRDASIAWYVREVDAGAVPGARGPRCLIWHAAGTEVRMWTYPANWELLSDTELPAIHRGPIA